MDRIFIRDLALRCIIGIFPEERREKQDVVINIEIRYAISEAALEDRIHGALNYKTITKEVIRHVEQGSFLLLEKLVADVLDICSSHRDVLFSRVTIDKPHALRFADSVSLSLEYQAEPISHLTLMENAS